VSTLSSHDLTLLLSAWSRGDPSALAKIIEIAYPELRRIAQRCLRNEHAGHTIRATALVHEAWIQLVDIQRMCWEDRVHFFAVSARIMRRVVVDHIREQRYARRGGGFRGVDFQETLAVSPELGPELADFFESHDTTRFNYSASNGGIGFATGLPSLAGPKGI
jgi:RNA polymerase sigma-70 factor (ECF subfamily)